MAIRDWLIFWRKIKKRKFVDSRLPALEKLYTPVKNLKIGMYVIELDRPWLDTKFFFQGFEIKTEEEIQMLKETCDYVYIDTTILKKPRSAKLNASNSEPQSLSSYPPPPPKISFFEDEIQRAKETYYSTGQLVSEFMDRIGDGESIDFYLAKQVVAECVNSILHSPDATLWLTQLKSKDKYTAQHSLNVCVLSIVLGRHIGLSELNLNNVGLCGLMHDLGKMCVPIDILNKPGKLEHEEMDIMQTHASLGSELLKSSEGMYMGAVNAAFSHHERIDGKGYPQKIKGEDLSLFTKIVTISDMYDAITSDRVYQKGRTHLEATKIMFEQSGLHVDDTLLIRFVESLGVYPPGCLVGLTNGAVGIVVESNDIYRLRPKIMLVLDEEKNPVPEEIFDLALLPKDKLGNVYTIRSIVKAEDYNIDTAKFYKEGILQKGFAMVNRR